MTTVDVAATEDTEKLSVGDDIVKAFASSTTLHGVNSIQNSRSRAGQVTWTILLCLAFGYTIRSTVYSVKRYMCHPFTTEISEEFAGTNGLKFPSITVCPMNMFVKLKIELHDDDKLFRRFGLNLDICEETKLARQKYNLTCGKFLMCSLDISSIERRDCGPEINVIMNALSQTKSNVTRDFQEKFQEAYGPRLEHSLQVCKFGSVRCGERDFSTQVTPYGNCYVYHGDSNNTMFSYIRGNLMLILNAKVKEYTKSPFYTEGFKLYVQDQGTYISPWDGFVVSPGNIATVEVRQKQFIYLSSPYRSNCTVKNLTAYSTYTMDGCLNECYNRLIVKRCGCRTCGYRVNMKANFNPKRCDCPPPCLETTYSYQVSYSSFPDAGSTRSIAKYHKLDLQYQRKNLVAVHIFYKATSYEKHEEKPTYSLEALLGELGGNLGLMVGCSVLTAAEILELLGRLIINCFNKSIKRREKRKVAW